jgi:hypothetical protein
VKALLEEMKDYIEDAQKMIDSEWGSCRSAKEIFKDGDMPEIYNKVLYEIFKLN